MDTQHAHLGVRDPAAEWHPPQDPLIDLPAWVEEHRVNLAEVRRDQIIGIGHAIEEVELLVGLLRRPELMQQAGATVPRGILVTGAPGTGKTTMAKFLAAELNRSAIDAPMFSFAADELDPERFRSLVAYLRRYKHAIVYLDEIDTWARSRMVSAGLRAGSVPPCELPHRGKAPEGWTVVAVDVIACEAHVRGEA